MTSPSLEDSDEERDLESDNDLDLDLDEDFDFCLDRDLDFESELLADLDRDLAGDRDLDLAFAGAALGGVSSFTLSDTLGGSFSSCFGLGVGSGIAGLLTRLLAGDSGLRLSGDLDFLSGSGDFCLLSFRDLDFLATGDLDLDELELKNKQPFNE